jgi:hypothetical protein
MNRTIPKPVDTKSQEISQHQMNRAIPKPGVTTEFAKEKMKFDNHNATQPNVVYHTTYFDQ